MFGGKQRLDVVNADPSCRVHVEKGQGRCTESVGSPLQLKRRISKPSGVPAPGVTSFKKLGLAETEGFEPSIGLPNPIAV